MRFALALKGIINNKRPNLQRAHRLRVAANVLRKGSRNSREDAADVPADEPTGTMRRFNEGLRRVLTIKKKSTSCSKKVRRKTSA